jgi:hypothetical protein
VPTPILNAVDLETGELEDWGLLEPPLATPLDGDMPSWAGTWNIHETLRKVYVIFK